MLIKVVSSHLGRNLRGLHQPELAHKILLVSVLVVSWAEMDHFLNFFLFQG